MLVRDHCAPRIINMARAGGDASTVPKRVVASNSPINGSHTPATGRICVREDQQSARPDFRACRCRAGMRVWSGALKAWPACRDCTKVRSTASSTTEIHPNARDASRTCNFHPRRATPTSLQSVVRYSSRMHVASPPPKESTMCEYQSPQHRK